MTAGMSYISFSVADVRVGADFHSERDSQLIFGEEVKVISESDDYLYVEGADKLKGYVLRTLVSEGRKKNYKIRRNYRSTRMIFPFGSCVNDEDISEHDIPENLLMKLEERLEPSESAHEFLTVPYLWGGTSDLGYDCSGFTQRLFRFNGIEIPRNAGWQRDNSLTVDSFEDAESGDLVFFEGHVGLYLGNNTIIHANLHNGGVTYSDLSDGSEYSQLLLKIFEKVGRIDRSTRISLPY